MVKFRKDKKPFDRVGKLLAEVPGLRSVKSHWCHDDVIDIFAADKTPSSLSYNINHELDNGSWCWVRLLTDFEDYVIKIELPEYRCTMWDALHHLRERGFLLERVTHIFTYLEEGDGTIASYLDAEKSTNVWRVNKPNGFLVMYLDNYRTKQFHKAA